MNRRHIVNYLGMLLVLLCISAVQAATFTATVDRTQINAGESIELILESNDSSQFLAPDLTPLKPFFELINSKQVNRFSTAQGFEEPITQWILTLLPKQTGFLIIPPLSLGERQSAPINLYIKEPVNASTVSLEPVYINAQLDQESVYVQAQALLTLRIYHAIPLFADSNLTPLLLDNARVESLGKPRTFEQHINGVRHGVIEIRYAIFPQQSGLIEIPQQTFTATLAGHNPQSLTPFSAQPGQRIEVKSARIPLQVKDIPQDYPKHTAWLPAQRISLEHSWTPNLDTPIAAGTAITRRLTVHAQGLPDSQLPALTPPPASTYAAYVDQPSFGHQFTEQGLVSHRDERQAFVFQNAALHTLPAIKLAWWNTLTDQLEYANLPAQYVQVIAATLIANPTDSASLSSDSSTPVLDSQQLWAWQALSAVLLALSLLGFGLWWRARHQPAITPPISSGPTSRNLQDDLKRACLSNDPRSTRQALDAWARQHPESLADIAMRDDNLSDALDALNSALYSENYSNWQGQALWHAIGQLSFTEPTAASSSDQLPPLYPP